MNGVKDVYIRKVVDLVSYPKLAILSDEKEGKEERVEVQRGGIVSVSGHHLVGCRDGDGNTYSVWCRGGSTVQSVVCRATPLLALIPSFPKLALSWLGFYFILPQSRPRKIAILYGLREQRYCCKKVLVHDRAEEPSLVRERETKRTVASAQM